MTAIRALAGVVAASRRRPAPVQNILGYDTKGSANASSFSDNRMYVSKFTLASSGTMTELHGWFNASGGFVGNQVKLVIYADSAGSPGARKANTSAISLPNGDTHAQQTGFSVALAAGDYWIGWVNPVGPITGFSYGENTGGTHKGKTSGANFTTPDDPFGSTDTSGTRKHSVWAVIT